MTRIDQFESVFKAAEKTRFQFQPVTFRKVLVVADQSEERTAEYQQRVRSFLEPVAPASGCEVEAISGGDYQTVADLLQRVEQARPDLICTYRNLHLEAESFPFSVGVFVEVLTQATSVPVLLTPRAVQFRDDPSLLSSLQQVMAITDHLTGDNRLVSWAASFTAPGGTLWLTHMEDLATFERYLRVISRIQEIDTDVARQQIRDRLLKEPRDFIASCADELRRADLDLQIRDLVSMGDPLSDYRRLVEQHRIDLLVLNTKDADQQAMHGMAYPLTVELREIPMLLL